MSEYKFTVGENGGKKLKTAGKYCDKNIQIDLDEAIPVEVEDQSTLIDQAINDLNAEVDEQSDLLDRAAADLDKEVTEQSALLDKAISALHGKTASGGVLG